MAQGTRYILRPANWYEYLRSKVSEYSVPRAESFILYEYPVSVSSCKTIHSASRQFIESPMFLVEKLLIAQTPSSRRAHFTAFPPGPPSADSTEEICRNNLTSQPIFHQAPLTKYRGGLAQALARGLEGCGS